ncbi:MAG: hypothetical protein JJE39_08400 [Vicinamibacteria bacterium]|nr:hypothetical protein [Vicinamibacteria bacterium]
MCRLYDIAEAEGHHFLVMEYVDGEDLASLLRRIGRFPGDKALDIARDVCAGRSRLLRRSSDRCLLHIAWRQTALRKGPFGRLIRETGVRARYS